MIDTSDVIGRKMGGGILSWSAFNILKDFYLFDTYLPILTKFIIYY